jgi:hypothetical protein
MLASRGDSSLGEARCRPLCPCSREGAGAGAREAPDARRSAGARAPRRAERRVLRALDEGRLAAKERFR